MTEVPQFRVFLKDNERFKSLNDKFPQGIICCDFIDLNEGTNDPINMVLLVDINRLVGSDHVLLDDVFKSIYTGTIDTEGTAIPYIPLSMIKTVTDLEGAEISTTSFISSKFLVENARKFEEINFSLNGGSLHLLIMGLQQALFVSPNSEPSLNDCFLTIVCELINKITKGDVALNELYYYGFPCEYMEAAKEKLNIE